MKRTLSLKREALAALAHDDLAAVGGAAQAATPGCPTWPVMECLSWDPGCSTFCTD